MPEGIMEIRSDQVAAKQYLIAVAHLKTVVVHRPELRQITDK